MNLSRKIPLKSLFIIVAASLVAGLAFFRCLASAELPFYDARFILRGPQPTSSDIVIIDIDDITLNSLGVWPLPRDFHASLVDTLTALGAKAVVFDLLFSEASAHDEVFAMSLIKSGHVYLPQAFDLKDNSLLADITPKLKNAALAIGHINTLVDSDGKIRRVPLFIHQGKERIPQLAFKVACDNLRMDVSRVLVPTGDVLLVNYPGRWQDSFLHLSYAGILQSYMLAAQGQKPTINLNTIKGKVCFIGLTATGTSDLKAMPLENIYPMLGLQASVYNSIITKKFIYEVPPVVNALLALLVFGISLVFGFCWGPWLLLGATMSLAIAYGTLSVVLFNIFGALIDVFWPLSIMALTYVGSTLFKFLKEIKNRQLMEKELEIAQRIQQSFLPKNKLEIQGVAVVSFFRPAKFVAGDLYDIWKIDEHRVGVFVGDVSGKGVSAALVMAETISVLRTLAGENLEYHQLLCRLNKQLHGRMGGRFVTALFFVIDTQAKKVYAVSAGHGPLLISRSAGQEIIDLPLQGQVPLGLLADVPYETVCADLKAGDRIIAFSDGLPEARNNKGEEFGDQKVLALARGQGGSAADLLTKLQGAVEGFSTKQAHDDITIVVAGLKGG